MKAWKECPICGGIGSGADPIQGSVERQLPRIPCPTCAAHFKAVDSARDEEGKRIAELVKAARELQKEVLAMDNEYCPICHGITHRGVTAHNTGCKLFGLYRCLLGIKS